MATLAWFSVQIALAALAIVIAPSIARRSKAVWGTVCIASLSVLMLWPLMRLVPTLLIDALGAPATACLELTGLFIPAVLLFAVAARHVPRPPDRRALYLLIPVAALYFLKAGWWMVAPGVPSLGPTEIDPAGVCRQTTGYTCVAASMVTMLRARGIDATEEEMARLAYTEVGGGATDSRALWALERKLKGTGLSARYRALDLPGLIAVTKPCLVQLDWGYFVSHMVPVMAADETTVTIGDPLHGRREMPATQFARQWKGMAITVEEWP